MCRHATPSARLTAMATILEDVTLPTHTGADVDTSEKKRNALYLSPRHQVAMCRHAMLATRPTMTTILEDTTALPPVCTHRQWHETTAAATATAATATTSTASPAHTHGSLLTHTVAAATYQTQLYAKLKPAHELMHSANTNTSTCADRQPRAQSRTPSEIVVWCRGSTEGQHHRTASSLAHGPRAAMRSTRVGRGRGADTVGLGMGSRQSWPSYACSTGAAGSGVTRPGGLEARWVRLGCTARNPPLLRACTGAGTVRNRDLRAQHMETRLAVIREEGDVPPEPSDNPRHCN